MEDGPPYVIEKYFMPETKEAKAFLESLPKGSYSAEKVYERSLLSVMLDILFLLDRDQMLETFKKLICDYSGSLEGALDFLEKFADPAPLRERIITLKLIKAQLMLAKGEQDECIKLLESLKENAETEKERFYATMFLLRTSSDKKEALEKEKLSKKESSLIENECGKALWNADKYPEAKKRFENFLNLADDDFLKSIAYNNIGLSAGCMGDYQCALEMLERSLNLCEKMGDRCGSLRARLNIGELLKEMGMLTEAESMLLSVLNEASIVNTLLGARIRADCCINLAEIEILRNNPERALELCNSAYKEQCGDRTVELRALIIRARAEVIDDNMNEAKSLIERAAALAEELSSKRYEASAYLVKGMIHEREGDYKDALQSYGLAIFFFRKINNLYGAANAEERIGRLYENSKEKDKAEEHKKRARELLESFRAPRE
ncbi:MAG: tetratricopeptide repeat protein [Candidatus Thermoplasmatota archaeon]|nr:tetratricopeptide repeat protein [Candidatus Thermoplasmatota archaeon]